MMQIYRIAHREYMENVKTKGFWIGILLFPILIWMMIELPKFLEERGIPTRHLVIVDRSEGLGEIARQRITLLNRQKTLGELQQHMAKATEEQRKEKMEEINIDPDQLLDQLEQGLEQLGNPDLEIQPFKPDQLVKIGDLLPEQMLLNDLQWNNIKKLLLSQLPDDAAEFVEPPLRFKEVSLPEGTSLTDGNQQIENALRPYLRSEMMLKSGDEEVELFGLLIIPEDALEP